MSDDEHLIRASSGERKPISGVVRPENGNLNGFTFKIGVSSDYDTPPASWVDPDTTEPALPDDVADLPGVRVKTMAGANAAISPTPGSYWCWAHATDGNTVLLARAEEEVTFQ